MAFFSWLNWTVNDSVQAAEDEGRLQAGGRTAICSTAVSRELFFISWLRQLLEVLFLRSIVFESFFIISRRWRPGKI